MNGQENRQAVNRGDALDSSNGQVATGNTVIQVGTISGGTVNLKPSGAAAPAATDADPSTLATGGEHEALQALRQALDDHFGAGDLRDLAFDLAIEYDDLPGETRKHKARELVVYCYRRGRLEELKRAILVRRPGVF